MYGHPVSFLNQMSSSFRKRKREGMFRNCIRWPIQIRSKHDQSCPFCTLCSQPCYGLQKMEPHGLDHLSLLLGGEESSLIPIFECRDIWASNRLTVRSGKVLRSGHVSKDYRIIARAAGFNVAAIYMFT